MHVAQLYFLVRFRPISLCLLYYYCARPVPVLIREEPRELALLQPTGRFAHVPPAVLSQKNAADIVSMSAASCGGAEGQRDPDVFLRFFGLNRTPEISGNWTPILGTELNWR